MRAGCGGCNAVQCSAMQCNLSAEKTWFGTVGGSDEAGSQVKWFGSNLDLLRQFSTPRVCKTIRTLFLTKVNASFHVKRPKPNVNCKVLLARPSCRRQTSTRPTPAGKVWNLTECAWGLLLKGDEDVAKQWLYGSVFKLCVVELAAICTGT